MTYDRTIAPRRYVRLNLNNDDLMEDRMFTPEDATDANERLAADGSAFRWVPWPEDLKECVA